MCVNCTQAGFSAIESIGLEPQLTKTLSLATAAVMLFSLAAPLATPANSIKAGAVCSKPNQKVVQGKNTFVCKKSGKKLVWRIQVKKPTNNAQPKPPVVPTTPIKQLTAIEQLYVDINKSMAGLDQKNLRIKTIVSPKVKTNRVAEILQRYEASIQSFGNGITTPITMVFFDETDKDWWTKQVAELEGSRASFSWWGDGHCPINPNQICGYGNKIGSNQIYYHLVGSNSVWQSWHQHVADHEAVHMWQGSFWPTMHVTCWFTEGHANGLGYAISYLKTPSSVLQERKMQISRLASDYPNYKTFTQSDWVKVLNEKATPNCGNTPGLGYSFGMLAFEAMYGQFGFQKVTDFTIEVATTKSVAQGATNHFGINQNQLYDLIGEYAVKAIKAEG